MKKMIIAILAVLSLSACTDADGARRVLTQNGYTNVHVGGYAWFSCSEKDTFATKFTAVNKASGQVVNGAVCSGLLFKNSTIRFE
ncbi:hypothetical protein F485_gp199 [Aeromonas phage CC2]|uniref:Lipoprotein n=1 Tax=Aeromonas phage CC2 TaxID=1204516 RepID=I6XH08_9CAUD|nr:hypothetical protein F485_gp199 [Aeromonas phage CC2]AFN39341.1 hypothetical protein CC2_096 [Aeromonas phage CC2]